MSRSPVDLSKRMSGIEKLQLKRSDRNIKCALEECGQVQPESLEVRPLQSNRSSRIVLGCTRSDLMAADYCPLYPMPIFIHSSFHSPPTSEAILQCLHRLLSPKATDSLAGGNATGSLANNDPTLKGSNIAVNSTLSGSGTGWRSKPVALPPAIEFVAFSDRSLCTKKDSTARALQRIHRIPTQQPARCVATSEASIRLAVVEYSNRAGVSLR